MVGPIYFMAIIIILKLTLKSPYMEAVLDPPGASNVISTMPLRGWKHQTIKEYSCTRTIIMMPWFRKEIVYAPDDPTITNLMQKVEKALGPAAASFTGVADEGEILKQSVMSCF